MIEEKIEEKAVAQVEEAVAAPVAKEAEAKVDRRSILK